MKKYFMILMLAGTMFFVSGCGDKSYHTSDGGGGGDGSYYTFDGACVNLRHVKVLSSGIEVHNLDGDWVSIGGITSDNVNSVRKSTGSCRAYIAFDGVKVYLGDDSSKWLSEYQRVEKQFKSLKAQ